VRVFPHRKITVRLRVRSKGPWTLRFRARVTGFVGVRPVSVKATVPRLVSGRCTCPRLPPAEQA